MKRPPGTFVEVPIGIRVLDVSMGAKALLYTLCTYADYETGSCYPSLGTLATAVGADRSSVKRFVKELKDSKMIAVESRKGRRAVSKYRIAKWLWECVERPRSAQREPTRAVSAQDEPSVGSPRAVGGLIVSHELEVLNENQEQERIAVAEPTTAAEARAAVEAMLRETAGRLALDRRRRGESSPRLDDVAVEVCVVARWRWSVANELVAV